MANLLPSSRPCGSMGTAPRANEWGVGFSLSRSWGAAARQNPALRHGEKHPNYGPLLPGQPFLLYFTSSTAPLITFSIHLSPFTTERGGSQQPWSKVISKALSRRWNPGGNGPQRRRARPFLPLPRKMLRTDLRRISCSLENKKKVSSTSLPPSKWMVLR